MSKEEIKKDTEVASSSAAIEQADNADPANNGERATSNLLYPHQALGTSSDSRPEVDESATLPGITGAKQRRITERNKLVEALKKTTPKENIIIQGKLNIIMKIDGDREALCCKYNEDSNYIAVGYGDGIIKVYRSDNGELENTLFDDDVKENQAAVTTIKHRPVLKNYPITNCYTATYANGYVKCWNYNLNQCLYSIKEKRQTFGLVYHPRFPKFVTFGDDLKVYFYNEESQIQERVLTHSDSPNVHDGHRSRIFAACFHPRNNYELVTGGWDDLVQFWDLRQPHAIRHISGVHMCGEGLDINQKGTEILTCSWQKKNAIQIFDYGSGKLMDNIDPDIFSTKLYCGRFATKDFIVCAGSDPNLLRIVDLQTTVTSAFINQLPSSVYSLDLGPAKLDAEMPKRQRYTSKNDIATVPEIAFVAGKCLYQIDFY